MRRKVISILIATKKMGLTNQVMWAVRQTLSSLPLQSLPRFLKTTKFNDAKDMIECDSIDIFIIGKNLADEGNGEELVNLVRKLYPKHPIIFYVEDESIEYQFKMQKKVKRLECVTKKELFGGLKEPLLTAYDDIIEYKSRVIGFPELVFSIDNTCYIRADGNYIEAHIYDFEEKTFSRADKKMTMKKFMEDYNCEDDFIRCHESYIVNKRMVRRVYKADGYLELIVEDKDGHPIEIPIGGTYHKKVVAKFERMGLI